MAKSKKNNDAEILANILSETGGETLRNAGQVPYYVDTGNLAINYSCSGKFINGGFPGGRIIEAYGPEASGKSFLGYCFMHSIQQMNGVAILLDCERSSGAEFAERCGHVDPDSLVVYDPVTLEQVEKKITIVVNKIRQVFPDKPIGIVWDSIGVNPTDREWNETELPENPTQQQIAAAGGNERPGERAKAANKVLRSLNPFLNNNNATLYVINQVRKKIGVIYGNDETTSGGGEALKFYASLRLRCGAPKSFQDKNTKLPLGVNMSVTNKKNRHFTPGVKIENVPLFFNTGINPLGGLMDALLMSERIEASSKGRYTIKPEWCGTEENTFQQAKSSPMNPEILYKNPKLIDADNEEEVRNYLKEWSDAISLTNSEGVEQISNGSEDVSHLVGTEDS